MKKNLVRSFLDGINDVEHGERYSKLFSYFYPEFITNLLINSLPLLVDAYFIGLISTTAYATVGVTASLIHLLLKSAESFSVGTVILTGQLNGAQDKPGAGKALTTSFWVSCVVGLMVGILLYFGAPVIYAFYDVSQEMLPLGIRYLQLRAIGIFFLFVYQAFIGFLRGVKNTQIPMISFVVGTIVYLIFDYLLIFGAFGLPQLGLEGSAIASIIQYAVASCIALFYLLCGPYTKSYAIRLFSDLRNICYVKNILSLSWPIMIDKVTLAFSYVWLTKMINPMGTNIVAAFCVVRDMSKFAFLPAVAFAQIITFLVSNDIGAGNWRGVKSNIKKVIFASMCLMTAILLVFMTCPRAIVHLFDCKDNFTEFAVHVFPVVSLFMFFDLLQVVLSGALRGAANVKIVMIVRASVLFGFFVPLSYGLAHLQLADDIKFILIYSSFYLANAIMACGYLYHFRSDRWKKYAGVSDD